MYPHNKEVAEKHNVDAERCFVIVDPLFYANSSVDIECRCRSCGRIVPGVKPDTRCTVCGGFLKPERIGSLDVLDMSGLDGVAVRVVIPRDEAPELLVRLDRALREGFGLRLSAVDGCPEPIAQAIDQEEVERQQAEERLQRALRRRREHGAR